MRSFNRARLADIAEKKLNPKEKLVVGKDGRLTSSKSEAAQASSKVVSKKEEKLEHVKVEDKAKEAVSLEPVILEKDKETNETETVTPVKTQEKPVEKKVVKKKPFSKSQPS
jgi:hypothetical protein